LDWFDDVFLSREGRGYPMPVPHRFYVTEQDY